MASDPANHRLRSVELDPQSLGAASRDQEQERQIAIFDLIEENHFAPAGGERRTLRPEVGLGRQSPRA